MEAGKPTAKDPVAGTDDRELVEAAQRDVTKFGVLYDIHFERVYAFIARRVRNRNTAEDLTSEVFHKALTNLRSYEFRGVPFSAWLIRIAANAVADQIKRDRRMPREIRETDDTRDRDEADFEMLENRVRLFRLVNRLPADQRKVILDRFVEQRSIREIAERMGRTEGAIKQLQFRALQNLRTHMEGPDA